MAGPMQTCTKCAVEKPLATYHLTPTGNRRRVCRECRNAASVARNKAWRERNPEEYRNRARAISKRAYYAANTDEIREQTRLARFARYGITEAEYLQTLDAQGHACAICFAEFTETPAIDHDHGCCPGYRSCGRCVRGLLCQNCNHGLGKFKDDVERLASAVRYLARGGQ